MFLTEPPPTNADLRFRLFGIPIRVHPLFWLGAALLGMNSRNAKELLSWIAAVFLGVLIHELGHAAIMRLYGYLPNITLYTFGGMASYGRGVVRRPPSWLGQIAISAAGPGTGFLAAALITLVCGLSGWRVEIDRLFGWILLPYVSFHGVPVFLLMLINQFLEVCVFWGVLNLMPILPLDGGHIASQVLLRLDPREGLFRALLLSTFAAGLLAIFAYLRLHDTFLAIFFAYLAFSSFRTIQGAGGGGW